AARGRTDRESRRGVGCGRARPPTACRRLRPRRGARDARSRGDGCSRPRAPPRARAPGRMTAVLRHGLARLRHDRGRSALIIAGVAAAAALVGAAVTMVFALTTAFDRSAARAGMPDVTARFADGPRAAVAARVRALANVGFASYRYEARDVSLAAGDQFAPADEVAVGTSGPRGYAVTAR